MNTAIKMTEEKIEITTSENIRFIFNNVENTKLPRMKSNITITAENTVSE